MRPGGKGDGVVRLFLAGDVMFGRGIDQILPHPVDPWIDEPWARSALDYVGLAERASGPIDRPVPFAYPWGDALEILGQARPDLRLVNLETAVTDRGEPWPGKGIQYRMSPGNLGALTAAGIDGCVLANNHVLDWGYDGLEDTLDGLADAGIATAGAGRDADRAAAPAVFPVGDGGRVLLFAWGGPDCGIPESWSARPGRCGVNRLAGFSAAEGAAVARHIRQWRRPGDIVVLSVHWGGNWGYGIPGERRAFAHSLIEAGLVDLVHGHSSHHPKGIEIHRGRPILHGCGDLVNDYEGIRGHEAFRPELSLMVFADIDRRDGCLVDLWLVPMRIRRMRLERAGTAEREWLAGRLDRECAGLGCRLALEDGVLRLGAVEGDQSRPPG